MCLVVSSTPATDISLLFSKVSWSTSSPASDHNVGHRTKRSAPTLANRTACNLGDEQPATRVDTTQRLADMRQAMTSLNIDAFIVLSDDAHGSEYPAESDLRRGFISGFSGSAGWAAVTSDQAAAWTDGRYFLEAEDALDCNWLFMRSGEKDVPSLTTWLTDVLKAGNKVGADPFLISNSNWMTYKSTLEKANISLVGTATNPVDTAWGAKKPEPPNTPINALELKYAGKSWQDKINDVILEMINKERLGAYVVTSLDEIAWLFNLRASDIAYNPFFLAYAVIEYDGTGPNRTSLYIYDKANRLTREPTDNGTSHSLHNHLNTGTDGQCNGTGPCVEVLDYDGDSVVLAIGNIAASSSDKKIWVTHVCNYAIFNAIPEDQRVQDRSYIALAKAQKNAVERKGMENSHNRDSKVLIEFLAKLERDVTQGLQEWDEVSAEQEVKRMRLEAPLNRGLSFQSISASGPNGAVIHYRPSAETNRTITTTDLYLLDSGGQYLDGTTDVTRTMHYGTPTSYEIECYTRVLMGHIDLALVIWPEGLYGREIDLAARAPLWQVGLEYRHGTGHGIGAYLSVHEGPGRISLSHAKIPSEEALYGYMFFSDGPGFISLSRSSYYSQEALLAGMYFSDEPGYYEDGKFGIRLETIVMVEPTNTTYKFGTKQFFKFKPITLVPYEPNLIDFTLLSQRQIDWFNRYNQLTREAMQDMGLSELAKNWMMKRTEPYKADQTASHAAKPTLTLATVVMVNAAIFTFLV